MRGVLGGKAQASALLPVRGRPLFLEPECLWGGEGGDQSTPAPPSENPWERSSGAGHKGRGPFLVQPKGQGLFMGGPGQKGGAWSEGGA